MKYILIVTMTAAVLPIFFSACATTEPGGLEISLLKQEAKMKKLAEKSRARSETREQKWKDYSSRADARYDQWLDSVMD